MTDTRDTLLSNRKLRDRSMVLLLVATALFLPPVVGVAKIDTNIGGVPAPLLFIFGVWAVLIVLAMLLAGRLSDSDHSPASSETGESES